MDKQFKNRIKQPLTFLLCLPGFLILTCIFGILAWWFLGDILNMVQFSPVSIWGGAAAAIVFFVLILLHIPAYPDYVITDKEIRILKRGKAVKTFPFSQYQIRPEVTTIRLGLIPLGTSRVISVQEAQSKPKRININLSKRDFNEFRALLDKFTS